MKNSHSQSYANAGVHIEEGYKGVELMSTHVKKTYIPGVLSDLGGFGGLFQPDLSHMEEPVLVSGTDGVGTKIRIAQLLNKHDRIGIDCVAMCANDIVCSGAKPLFFLDYIAIGKNEAEKVADLVKGVAQGCVESGCALIGGETAEHPGVMSEDDYDLAGFCVGIVDKKKIINSESMKEGDVLIGLSSSGIHSNGYSLVRKILDVENRDLNAIDETLKMSWGEALLTPTKLYVKPILKLLENVDVHGISHITGGGFFENVPRMMKDGLCAHIEKENIKVPAVFTRLMELGNIPERDMYNTFNMGIGMVVAVECTQSETAMKILKDMNCDAAMIGEVIAGSEKIELC